MPQTETTAAESAPGAEQAPAAERPTKHLLFRLGDEQFGFDVMSVREIVGMHPLTLLPNSATYLAGVMNLRGRVIPVIDLRLRLDMTPRPFDARTCLVVVDSGPQERPVQTALAVDSVSEVCAVAASDIESPPNSASRTTSRYLRGLTRIENKVTLLLNVDEVARLDEEESVVDELSIA